MAATTITDNKKNELHSMAASQSSRAFMSIKTKHRMLKAHSDMIISRLRCLATRARVSLNRTLRATRAYFISPSMMQLQKIYCNAKFKPRAANLSARLAMSKALGRRGLTKLNVLMKTRNRSSAVIVSCFLRNPAMKSAFMQMCLHQAKRCA